MKTPQPITGDDLRHAVGAIWCYMFVIMLILDFSFNSATEEMSKVSVFAYLCGVILFLFMGNRARDRIGRR